MNKDQYNSIQKRSGGCCEAMVKKKRNKEIEYWSRCFDRPVEMHHALTRARGGRILDSVGETYHIIALCRWHHALADGGDAYEGSLLIDGYVLTGKDGNPEYTGTDEYLSKKYPPKTRTRDANR